MTHSPVSLLKATVSFTRTPGFVFSTRPHRNDFWKYVDCIDLEKTPGIGQYNI